MFYYVVESKYIGGGAPRGEHRCGERRRAHRVEIRTSPALTNMSREPLIWGWCGTTNDFSKEAWGEYPTLEAARSAVHKIFVFAKEVDPLWGDDDVVAEFEALAYRRRGERRRK